DLGQPQYVCGEMYFATHNAVQPRPASHPYAEIHRIPLTLSMFGAEGLCRRPASTNARAEPLVLDQPRRLAVQDVMCTFFADHDRGCLGVPADQRRHDGGVDDTQTVEAADSELLVYHGHVVFAHLAGTHRVVVSLGPLADVIADLGIGANLDAGHMFALDERCVCLGGQHLPAPLEALKGDLPVVWVAEEIGVDGRRNGGVGAVQRHRAHALGPQVASVDRHAVAADAHAAVVDDERRQAVHLDIRGHDVAARADEHAGLAHRRGDRPGAVQHVLNTGGECLEGPVGLVVADRGGFGGEVNIHVVLEVLANTGQVMNRIDANGSEFVGGADT